MNLYIVATLTLNCGFLMIFLAYHPHPPTLTTQHPYHLNLLFYVG